MAALAGAWAREVAADAWPGPVNEGAPRAHDCLSRRAHPTGQVDGGHAYYKQLLEKYGASNIAYVKAATQDEREDTVSRWCAPKQGRVSFGKALPHRVLRGVRGLSSTARRATSDSSWTESRQ